MTARFAGGVSPRIAVLVDADNVSHKHAKSLMEDVARRGRITHAHLYGNFASPKLSGWAPAIQTFAFRAHHHYSVAECGKNSADIALAIDAMDIAHSRQTDQFAVVSNDSDLSPLASRLRRLGFRIYGYGTRNASDALRKSCSEFLFLEEIAHGLLAGPLPQHGRRTPQDAEGLLLFVLLQMGAREQPVPLTKLGEGLRAIQPTFNPRHYRSANLKDLVRKLELLELHEETMIPTTVSVRRAAAD